MLECRVVLHYAQWERKHPKLGVGSDGISAGILKVASDGLAVFVLGVPTLAVEEIPEGPDTFHKLGTLQ